MLLKRFLISFAALSLSACGHGPTVTVCVLNAVNLTSQCSTDGAKAVTVPVSQMNNDVCLPPADAEALFNYLNNKCR